MVPAATARGCEQLCGVLCCKAPSRDSGGRHAGKGRLMEPMIKADKQKR